MTAVEITQLVSAVLTPVSVMVVAYFQYRTKERLKIVSATMDETKSTVRVLEANTNNKMDQLLKATNAASFKAGQEGMEAPHAQSIEKETPQ